MKEIIKKIEGGRLLLEVSTKFYDKKAIVAASYKFTDQAYIHINSISELIVGVYFKGKESNGKILENIAYNFCNELIDQQLRIDIEASYGNIRDLIVQQAFSPIEDVKERLNVG